MTNVRRPGQAPAKGAYHKRMPPHKKGPSVLVAEDSHDIAMVLDAVPMETRHRVQCADNAPDAFYMLYGARPDVAPVDCPGDGLGEILAKADVPTSRVVLMTKCCAPYAPPWHARRGQRHRPTSLKLSYLVGYGPPAVCRRACAA